jgi:phosphate transport system substrate-binding protein
VAAELYMAQQPGVRVTVAISGTGGGFQKFCIGETDGNDSSRPITDEEIAICTSNDIGFDFVQVANDALSIVVNAELPVDCMTVAQVSQIWDDGSTVQTWGDIDGLDLSDDVASEAITVYGPGSDSGTFDFFTEAINGESGRIRNDYIDIGEDDLAAVRAVESDPYAMGYIPFSYYQEAGEAVKALAIDDGDGCVEATPENVQDLTYTPLGRGLFVYFSDFALSRPEVLDFAEFYVTNAAEIAELAEFVAMTPEQLADQAAKVAALAGG